MKKSMSTIYQRKSWIAETLIKYYDLIKPHSSPFGGRKTAIFEKNPARRWNHHVAFYFTINSIVRRTDLPSLLKFYYYQQQQFTFPDWYVNECGNSGRNREAPSTVRNKKKEQETWITTLGKVIMWNQLQCGGSSGKWNKLETNLGQSKEAVYSCLCGKVSANDLDVNSNVRCNELKDFCDDLSVKLENLTIWGYARLTWRIFTCRKQALYEWLYSIRDPGFRWFRFWCYSNAGENGRDLCCYSLDTGRNVYLKPVSQSKVRVQ